MGQMQDVGLTNVQIRLRDTTTSLRAIGMANGLLDVVGLGEDPNVVLSWMQSLEYMVQDAEAAVQQLRARLDRRVLETVDEIEKLR